MSLDPRLYAVREDLAAEKLRGMVSASAWHPGTAAQVTAPSVRLHKIPDHTAATETTLLYGASLKIYDLQGDFAWAQADQDDYVGYVAHSALGPPTPTSHWVAVRHSHIYAGPNLKTAPLYSLGLGARLWIADDAQPEKGFLPLANGTGWIWQRHIVPQATRFSNHIAFAKQFIGTPYIWGGCDSSQGIDCSALVQITMGACGIKLPRDSDQQREGLWGGGDWARCPTVTPTPTISPDGSLEGFNIGDIVFFPGHVGFMAGNGLLLHANASHMQVALDLLHQVVYTPCGQVKLPVLAVRRPLIFGQ